MLIFEGHQQISMHQSFRLNGSDYYTIFDLPILVTNEISGTAPRPSCDSLDNKLLPAAQGNATGPRALLPYRVPKEGPKDGPKTLGAAGALKADLRVVFAASWMLGLVVWL